MRKPVCVAVIGVSIVVAAVSLGTTLTRYLGLLAYSPKGEARAAATPAVTGVPSMPPSLWNNLFAPGDGMKLASKLPATDVRTASGAPRANFVLVGTIVSSTPSARRAILWANGMKEPKAFREKEEIEPGAILSSVERDKVWITRGSEREKLEILPVGTRGRPTATATSPAPPPVAALAPPPAVPGMQPSPGGTRAVPAPEAASVVNEEEKSFAPGRARRRSMRNRR
jgi:Type II secretion system protein C